MENVYGVEEINVLTGKNKGGLQMPVFVGKKVWGIDRGGHEI